MGSEWREVQLGEVVRLTTGYPFKSQHYTNDVDAPRLIGGDNIVQGDLRWDNVRRWPLDMTSGLDDYWLEPGDVVLAMDRPWIEAGLKRAVIGTRDVPSLLIQRTARLRGTDELDAVFLRYVISSQAFTQHILSVQTGTAVPHISSAQILAFRFTLPPLAEQRAIAETLGALDDRIDSLRQTNATLQAIAAALFKSHFVDVDGQDDGRRAFIFGEIADLSKGSVSPGAQPETVFQHYSLPAFDSAQMPVAETGKSIKSNKTPVPSGAVLVSKLNPHIPRVWFVGDADENAVCSTEFLVWTPKPGIGSAFVYCAATSPEFNSLMRQLVTGTSNSHQRVKPDQLANAHAAFASEASIAAFEETAGPLLRSVEHNRRQAATLSAIRDTLLPRLISGKLRVGADNAAGTEAD